jgi:hypothetical protein
VAVGQRNAIINQIRAFLQEQGIAVRQGMDGLAIGSIYWHGLCFQSN